MKQVVDLNIPTSQYFKLAQAPKIFDDKSQTFVPATVEGVPIPSFNAPVADFKYTWKLLKESFKLHRTGNNSFAYKLEDAIRFFFKYEAYAKHIKNPSNLEVIIQGDGFPVI